MYSASASAALNSGVSGRVMTSSNPGGANSRAMSLSFIGLSATMILGAMARLLQRCGEQNSEATASRPEYPAPYGRGVRLSGALRRKRRRLPLSLREGGGGGGQ